MHCSGLDCSLDTILQPLAGSPRIFHRLPSSCPFSLPMPSPVHASDRGEVISPRLGPGKHNTVSSLGPAEDWGGLRGRGRSMPFPARTSATVRSRSARTLPNNFTGQAPSAYGAYISNAFCGFLAQRALCCLALRRRPLPSMR